MEEVGGPSNTVISHSPLKREYGRFQPPWPWASLFGSAVSLSLVFETLGCDGRIGPKRVISETENPR
jgi:hypothetical protein